MDRSVTRPVPAVILLALTAAGCGSGSGGDQKPRETPVRPTVAASRTPARTPGFPQAADGKNVRACHDGSCEILVTKRTKIPLDPRFGFKTFSFDPSDSTWRYTYPIGGSGRLKWLEPPYSGSWVGPTGKQQLVMTVVASDGSKAVISLRPGK
ncbi:hypothetical protein OG417_18665 [Actinoallomurus sp. NBC_01490]|jgi:hypothetical protein|uniref:hypothetical protein n=1 Tax=Actinoallomurus sp. NBC_01490 TaxID=2903557 RepID=UPI002E35C339|nr:hypothetical protein [Actinoallomurus sp. NBC_01490]